MLSRNVKLSYHLKASILSFLIKSTLIKDQRVQIVESHYEDGSILQNTFWGIRAFSFKIIAQITPPLVDWWRNSDVLALFWMTFIDPYSNWPFHRKIAAVSDSVAEEPRTSVRWRAQQTGLSTYQYLGLRAYKMVVTQELEPENHGNRRKFVN